MDQTLAYQIGAMFLLAALFMAGSRAKSLLGYQTLRALRMTALIAGGALFAYIGYQKWPDIYAMARSAVAGPEAPASSATPAPAVVPASEVHRKPKVPARPAAEQYILYSAPETPTPSSAASPVAVSPVTPAVASEPGVPESSSRGKRVIKSVGRFLHIGPKKQSTEDAGRQ